MRQEVSQSFSELQLSALHLRSYQLLRARLPLTPIYPAIMKSKRQVQSKPSRNSISNWTSSPISRLLKCLLGPPLLYSLDFAISRLIYLTAWVDEEQWFCDNDCRTNAGLRSKRRCI